MKAIRGSLRCVPLLAFGVAASALGAQRLLDQSPNTRAAWTMARGQPALVLSHRFEFVSGGDELLNVPLVTIGSALSERFALGFDFTSNSETAPDRIGGNELQPWLSVRGPQGRRGGVHGLLAYNTAARSVDAAMIGRLRSGPLSVIAEARAFSDAFGSGDAGFAGAGGMVLHLTPFASASADVGQAFSPDGHGSVWGGGITIAIPGTRHEFSFHGTNGGAATLQGASRRKVIGPESVRYGFAFIAPLGTAAQWRRIFRRGGDDATGTSRGAALQDVPSAPTTTGDTVRVAIRGLAFVGDTVRIRAGQVVLWENADPVAHTIAADDKSWKSAFINQGQDFARRFAAPGTYAYHCEPHPHMKGVVIVSR